MGAKRPKNLLHIYVSYSWQNGWTKLAEFFLSNPWVGSVYPNIG